MDVETDTRADAPSNGHQCSVLRERQEPREPPSFITLPTEILLEIHSFLSSEPAGFVLPLVCKRLFHTFPIPRWEYRENDSKQAALLCFLEEKCGLFHSRYRVCYGGCRSGEKIAVHPRSDFHPLELEYHSFRGPKTRACVLYAKSLWVSPSKLSSALQLVRQRDDPPLSNEDEGVVVSHGHFDYAMRCRYEMLTVPEQTHVLYEDMARILSGFGLYACPHMKLNNRYVMESFPERQTINDPGLFDRKDMVFCGFPTCDTDIYWVTKPSAPQTEAHQGSNSGSQQTTATSRPSRQKTIYLYTDRIIGHSYRGFDSPLALSQLIIPNTLRLTAYWNQCLEWKSLIAPPIAQKYENGQPSPSPLTGIKRFPGLPDLAPEPDDEPLFWLLYTKEPEKAPDQDFRAAKNYKQTGFKRSYLERSLDLAAWIRGEESNLRYPHVPGSNFAY